MPGLADFPATLNLPDLIEVAARFKRDPRWLSGSLRDLLRALRDRVPHQARIVADDSNKSGLTPPRSRSEHSGVREGRRWHRRRPIKEGIKEGTGRRRRLRLGADDRPSPQQKALPRAGLPRSMPRAQRHARRGCGRIAGGWGRREGFRMQSRRGVVSSSGLRSLCRCSPDPERRGSPTPQRAIPSFLDGNDYSGAVRRCLSADQPARGMNRASPEWRNVIYWAPRLVAGLVCGDELISDPIGVQPQRQTHWQRRRSPRPPTGCSLAAGYCFYGGCCRREAQPQARRPPTTRTPCVC